MALNCLLFFSTILYFVAFLCCLGVIIALAVVRSTLEGKCLLYIDNVEFKVTTLNSSGICDFNLYVPIATSIYAFGMGAYNGYAAYVAFKETHVGRTMWVMPWMLVNSLVFIVTLIGCAAFSVGFQVTCSNFTKKQPSLECKTYFGAYLDGNQKAYNSYNVIQILCWASLVVWLVAFATTVMRFIRNRRARSRDTCVESNLDPITLSTA